jgi:LPXTG-site transpeptidase (sortase) family protein
MNIHPDIKKKTLKALAITLELLALGLILYLVVLPFYPLLQYKYEPVKNKTEAKNINVITQTVAEFKNTLPAAEYAVSPDRLIIKKIGVNAPIVEAKNSDYGLSKGAWRVPESSTPDKGGNTVITGHRFKYLPPSNLTFYLLNKLEPGDIISVIWKEQDYYYKVKEVKIVKPEDLSILKSTKDSILTLYTCDPIYSQDNRLVVISELIPAK